MKGFLNIIFISLPLITLISNAGHPLRTEDGFPLGTNSFEIEIVSEYYDYSNNSEISLPISFGYGITSSTDILVGFSYHKYWDDRNNFSSFNDILIELKQMIFTEDVRFGIKPFISIPSGDEAKGFGKGKLNFGMMILLTKEWEKFHIHTQLGYQRNNNVVNENENLWEYSIALEKLFSERFSGLLEFGIARSCCPDYIEPPKFISLGASYLLEENLAVSMGILKGIHSVDQHLGLTGGITITF
ncbi:MAG: transporter [Melioribacteraceae bacterium]|nr:transporter [Melioribacteraceae bacterium]